MKLRLELFVLFVAIANGVFAQSKALDNDFKKGLSQDICAISNYKNWTIEMEVENGFERYYELKSISKDTIVRLNLTSINKEKFALELYEKIIKDKEYTKVLGVDCDGNLLYVFKYLDHKFDEREFILGYDYYKRRYL